MAVVGAFEAKTHLPKLLERAQQGEEITITKRGVPVAVLGPPPSMQKKDFVELFAEMKELRKGRTPPPGMTIRDMIEEGRRF